MKYINLGEVEILVRNKPKLSSFYQLIRSAREYHSVLMDLRHATDSFSLALSSQRSLSPIVLFYLQSQGYVLYARAVKGDNAHKYVESVDKYFSSRAGEKELSDRLLKIRDKVIAHHDAKNGSMNEIDQFLKDRMFVNIKNGKVVGTQAPYSRHLPSLTEVPRYLVLIDAISSHYGAKLESACLKILEEGKKSEIALLILSANLLDQDPLFYMTSDDPEVRRTIA